jgi:hypothetical protein
MADWPLNTTKTFYLQTLSPDSPGMGLSITQILSRITQKTYAYIDNNIHYWTLMSTFELVSQYVLNL